MSKKDKTISVKVEEATVLCDGITYEGYSLDIANRTIGYIAEVAEGQFAAIYQGKVASIFKTEDAAIAYVLEKYHLNQG